MDDALVRNVKETRPFSKEEVLILVVMDDALVPFFLTLFS